MDSSARKPVLALVAAIALTGIAAGCGGSSGSATTSTSAQTPAPATRPESAEASRPQGAGAAKAAKPGKGSEAQSGGSGTPQGPKPQPSIAAEEAAPGDHSIQEYGSEAGGSEKEAVLSAMRSFFTAMGSRDYAKVCADLSASNRTQMRQFSGQLGGGTDKGCAATLAKLLNPAAAAAAKKASQAAIGKIRIGKGTAFVLFRPQGGTLSYFVLKEEGGAWKATSLAPGTPLDPTATP